MKKQIWIFATVLLIGFSAGVITGVAIDKDKVYNTTIKRIKQQRGQGDIVIDVDPDGQEKTKKEQRQDKRSERREAREEKRSKP